MFQTVYSLTTQTFPIGTVSGVQIFSVCFSYVPTSTETYQHGMSVVAATFQQCSVTCNVFNSDITAWNLASAHVGAAGAGSGMFEGCCVQPRYFRMVVPISNDRFHESYVNCTSFDQTYTDIGSSATL
jgi:hypothetical protein